MATNLVVEVDVDDNNCITIKGLRRDGIWTPFFSVRVTEELEESYRFPLLLKMADS